MTITPEIIAGYRAITTPSISDALSVRGLHGYVHSRVQRQAGGKLVGPAVTVKEEPWDGDPVPPTHALEAIDASPAGSVIVIDNGGDETVACWGGLMAAGATVNGLEGAVIDGGVRDVEEINRDFAGLNVFAAARISATTVGRYRTVSSGEPVTIGGVEVRQGDLMVGDLDGVVVVPQEIVAEVLEEARLIEQREREQTALILSSGSLSEGLAKYNLV
ncbi:dimethylmenaquinone methyltransferase [Leucobacter sp. UCD-THU]|uniref:Putative 4-hydroxy-4-methyl-2-oxoglutarate aldolase n=1 Tax=Leucobacter muris TaxID=1935379 RepID=A0ABX5QIL9_9MICO|nr:MULTISPECIES: RraA family protein [Leucobacter]EYT54576.1 dimethylmenaquinone methyltransferase [Leucobacter sp. UCD-THU]QAB18952.1 RraA family protein [Leucobacter muris]